MGRRRAFTLMEVLVLIGIFIVLLSIFVPYGLKLQESSRRISCARNLELIRDALLTYAGQNGHEFPRVVYDSVGNPDGYTAFTGPDADSTFAAASSVRPNDVTASLWLLLRSGLLNDARVFICPSSDDWRDTMIDDAGQRVTAPQRGNFRKPSNLSYSYASPFSSAAGFRLTESMRAEFALMADKNPGGDATMHAADSPPDQLSNGNSRNHNRAGQNVLFADRHVEFMRTPYVGVGRDNIYTARAVRPTTQAAELPPTVNGVVGNDVASVSNEDSYLVPTATDTVPGPFRPQPSAATQTTSPATTSTAPSTAPVP